MDDTGQIRLQSSIEQQIHDGAQFIRTSKIIVGALATVAVMGFSVAVYLGSFAKADELRRIGGRVIVLEEQYQQDRDERRERDKRHDADFTWLREQVIPMRALVDDIAVDTYSRQHRAAKRVAQKKEQQ